MLDARILLSLSRQGTKLIALRSAGFNQVDLQSAEQLGLTVARVPAYSPHAVAEHTIALMLALCRHLHKAYNRVREGNFALDGLLGIELHGRTAGVIGTGKIGAIVAKILAGFGCKLLGYDVAKNPEAEAAGLKYVSLDELFSQSDHHHAALPADAGDVPHHRRRSPGADETRRGARQHQPRQADRHESGDPFAQVGQARRAGPRRL